MRATAVMVVSALIFVLGIDLVKEALWDTRHRVSKPEYITIASITIAMTAWDFVIGVLFGIVVSCELVLTILYMCAALILA
jgi:SulP family sulfate permease